MVNESETMFNRGLLTVLDAIVSCHVAAGLGTGDDIVGTECIRGRGERDGEQ